MPFKARFKGWSNLIVEWVGHFILYGTLIPTKNDPERARIKP